MILSLALVFILSLLWGSFLNVVGHRLIRGLSIISPRSHCPLCKHAIAWYDLIPILSWFILKGHCRACGKHISALYPFIEFLTALTFTGLFTLVNPDFIPAYFLFFSALIVTIRTDLETLLISRIVTLFLIPLGILASFLYVLPLYPLESVLGSILGYGFLWATAKIFFLVTGKEGMGQGDLELLAFIGAFIGPLGVWATLLISTITGSIIGITYMRLMRKSHSIKIPFGPFLALGAMLYVLFEPFFVFLLTPVGS